VNNKLNCDSDVKITANAAMDMPMDYHV